MNYLYNGVGLPAPPEWDKTVYPHALIYPYWAGGYFLHVGSSIQYGHNDIGTAGFNLGEGKRWLCNGSWGDPEDMQHPTWFAETNPDYIVWTNTDLLYSDGNLWLAASEPVPVVPTPPSAQTAFCIGKAFGRLIRDSISAQST